MSSPSIQVDLPASFAGQVITQSMACFFFLIVPTLITLMVPFTRIELRHSDPGPAVTVRKYLLMFIPWKTEQIQNVTQVRADIAPERRYRGTNEERRKGQSRVRLATGQLVIVSSASQVIVQAAPELATKIAKQFEEFRADNSAKPITLTVYASWSLSYILGGAVTLLCAFYVLGVVLSVLTFLFKWVRPMLG